MKTKDSNWQSLKENVMNDIDNKLKDKMIRNAQRIGLYIIRDRESNIVTNLKETEKAWKAIPIQMNAVKKIN